MKIFQMIGKYHYEQVATNEKYREALDPYKKYSEEDISKFLQYLKNLEQMNEDNNKE